MLHEIFTMPGIKLEDRVFFANKVLAVMDETFIHITIKSGLFRNAKYEDEKLKEFSDRRFLVDEKKGFSVVQISGDEGDVGGPVISFEGFDAFDYKVFFRLEDLKGFVIQDSQAGIIPSPKGFADATVADLYQRQERYKIEFQRLEEKITQLTKKQEDLATFALIRSAHLRGGFPEVPYIKTNLTHGGDVYTIEANGHVKLWEVIKS